MKEEKLKIFYDGACHLCSKEVDGYLKRDRFERLNAIDISNPRFNPNDHGMDPKRVHKYFHVKTQTGQLLEGVPAFAAIWDTLEIFKPLSWFSKTTIGKISMVPSYKVFAEIRPYLPKRKDCEACRVA